MVKSHLIAKKRLEKVLDERVGSRGKLQEVVLGIERAKGDEEVRFLALLHYRLEG
jgi:charged multivesicular body protein 7